VSGEDWGDFQLAIGTRGFSVDWGPAEDSDPGRLCAAVYDTGEERASRFTLYVFADDKPELFRLALEAAHTLESRVDWYAEWNRLSTAVLDEGDRCSAAAKFAKRRLGTTVANAYREVGARLRKIHADESPDDLRADLASSLALVKGGVETSSEPVAHIDRRLYGEDPL